MSGADVYLCSHPSLCLNVFIGLLLSQLAWAVQICGQALIVPVLAEALLDVFTISSSEYSFESEVVSQLDASLSTVHCITP